MGVVSVKEDRALQAAVQPLRALLRAEAPALLSRPLDAWSDTQLLQLLREAHVMVRDHMRLDDDPPF